AGSGATAANNSNFLGLNSGNGATDASYSNFFGWTAGSGATAANNSNFLGAGAGSGATGAANSNFLGTSAGSSAINASGSNFFGTSAGEEANAAKFSNFLGGGAGYFATNASSSNFLGSSAGEMSTYAANSNFLGNSAGAGATYAANSTFIGQQSGNSATNAANSTFIGQQSGNSATNAANSTFIGRQSGFSDTVNNTTGNKYSILIGNYTSTGGFSNSISIGQGVSNSATDQLNIGRVIYATNIGSSTTATSSAFSLASVGIGMATPADKLQVFGDIRLGITGTTGCVKNFAGTGITGTCSSDERLKTNVVDFTDGYLDKMSNLKVITYNWNELANSLNKVNTTVTNYGLLAQNVEQYFPELVSVDSKGYKQVNYSLIPLYLLKSVQELSKKVSSIFDGTGTIKIKEMCIEDICVTKQQLQQMMQNQNIQPTQPAPVAPVINPEPIVDKAPTIEPVPEVVVVTPPEVIPVPVIEPTPEVVVIEKPVE
ncbi:tail fiber domain-containing protein, partial [Arenimonas sp.]|nr:tail fiber domain-containing protein [Candidatus Parcubacteria bacterium]